MRRSSSSRASSSLARSAGSVPAKAATASVASVRSRLDRIELFAGLLQHLQRHHLGVLQRTAVVPIGIEDLGLALDLVLGLLGDRRDRCRGSCRSGWRCRRARSSSTCCCRARGCRSCRRQTWSTRRLAVVADRVEAVGDRLVALADLHLRGLLAHHLVEDLRLPERASDQRDLVLIKVGYFLEQSIDRRRVDFSGIRPSSLSPLDALSRYCKGDRIAASAIQRRPQVRHA